jgi:hypothetical protein
MVMNVRYAAMAILALLLVGAVAAPALAADKATLTGRGLGEHHGLMARTAGFDGDHNPGDHHEGFSGWAEHHEGHEHASHVH